MTKRPLPVLGDSRVKRGSWPACHQGAALHAALRLAARPECAWMLIVVMICDTGERYVSPAFFGFD